MELFKTAAIETLVYIIKGCRKNPTNWLVGCRKWACISQIPTFHLLPNVPPCLSPTYLYTLSHHFFVLVTCSGIQMQISSSSSSSSSCKACESGCGWVGASSGGCGCDGDKIHMGWCHGWNVDGCGSGVWEVGASSANGIGWHVQWHALGGHGRGGTDGCQVEGVKTYVLLYYTKVKGTLCMSEDIPEYG